LDKKLSLSDRFNDYVHLLNLTTFNNFIIQT